MVRLFFIVMVLLFSWMSYGMQKYPSAWIRVGSKLVELKPVSLGPLRGQPRFGYTFHYGEVVVGDNRDQQFYLGDAADTQYYHGFSQSGSSDFVLRNDNCSGYSNPPHGRCTLDVKFTPSSVGVFTSSLMTNVTSSDGLGGFWHFTFTFTFKGTSMQRPPEDECKATGSVIGLDSQSLTEEIDIVGTDMSLVYSSRFAPEYTNDSFLLGSAYSFNSEGWTLSNNHFYNYSQQRLFLGTGEVESKKILNDSGAGYKIVSSDGSEIYQFSASGLHEGTYSALTFAPKYLFTYDGYQNLTNIMDAYGNVTTISRDPITHKMTSIASPFGQVTTLTLNGSGLISSVTNPKSEVHSFTYKTGTGLLETFTKPGGQVTTFTYDSNGRLLKDLGNGGNFWELIPSVGGITKESEMGRQTAMSMSYNSSGAYNRVMTSPSGATTTYVDNRGFGTSNVQSIGITTWSANVFDERLGEAFYRKNQAVETIGSNTLTTYYAQAVSYPMSTTPGPFNFSSITNTISRNGNVTSSEFDVATMQELVTTAAGATRTTTLDSYERPISIQIGSDTATALSYDTSGRLSSTIQGSYNQKTYTYNGAGYLQSSANALGEVTSYTYDLAGRRTSVTLPDTRVIQYAYDNNGNVTGVTPPSRPIHSFTFNAFELNDEYQPPTLSGVLLVNTRYAYNNDKQLTQITRPTGATATYAYGSTTGLLTGVTTAVGTNAYSYYPNTDLISRIDSAEGARSDFTYYGDKEESDTIKIAATNVQMGKVSRTFDSQHRVSAISAQGNASTPVYTISITRNGDDQPTLIGNLALTYTYPSGRLSTTTLDRISDSRTYDTYGNLSGYTAIYTPASGPTVTLYTYTLTRDTLHRISYKTETIQGVTTTFSYSYDNAGRLTTVLKNGLAYSNYVYDSNGNRTSGSTANAAFTSTFDNQDRLLTYGAGRSYGYNANGDRTSVAISGFGTQTYSWDALGNLKGVVTTAGDNVTYNHDGRNRNTRIMINGVTQYRNLYYNDLRLASRMDSAGVMQDFYVYGTRVNTPEYMIKGNRQRIITDHLGSPRLVVRASDGVVMQRLDYTDLGLITYDSNPGYQPYGYAGGIWYSHVVAYKFGARFYEPRAGRWLTKDPILFRGGDTNLYGYVLNDPINFIDPLGLWSLSVSGYAGWGGGITIGQNPDGQGFFGIQIGAGLGLGASFNKQGTSPDWGNKNGVNGGPALSVGGFGDVGGNFGPLGAGYSAAGGMTFLGGPGVPTQPYGNAGPYGGLASSFGLGLGASAGAEICVRP